jgi:hypothetical protein
MNRAPAPLTADFARSRLETLLQFVVSAGDPAEKSAHRARQMSLLARALALAKRGAVYFFQRNFNDQQAGADAAPLWHLFPSRKQESTGWTGLLQSSTADHSATPLLITDGTEKAFCDALETIIAMPSGRSKVIYHQQCVLGMECQRLQRICCRSEMTGKMRRVHGRPEVLLADCG